MGTYGAPLTHSWLGCGGRELAAHPHEHYLTVGFEVHPFKTGIMPDEEPYTQGTGLVT